MIEKSPVSGIAIKAGISRNGILYTAEELKKFTKTLKGVSIIKDHIALTDNSIGVVEKTSFDDKTESVLYEGWIKNDAIAEKIADGRIKHVSIGAMVERLVRPDEDSDFLIAKGMEAVELSTVVVPGVKGATITQALEAYKKAKTQKEKAKVPCINEELSKIKSSDIVFKITKKSVVEKLKKEENDVHKTEDVKTDNICTTTSGDTETVSESVEITDKTDVVEDKKNNNQDEEEVKMTIEDNKVHEAAIAEKDSELVTMKENLAAKEAKLAEAEAIVAKQAEAMREAEAEKYSKLCEAKKVKAVNVSKLTIESIKMLIEQVEGVEEPKEEPAADPAPAEDAAKSAPAETKGEVETPAADEDAAAEGLDGYNIEKSTVGSGYAISKESYDAEKYVRLAR